MHEKSHTQKSNGDGSTRGGMEIADRRHEARPKPELPPSKATNTSNRAKLAHGLNRKNIGLFDTKKMAYSTRKTKIYSQRYELYNRGVHDLDPRVFGKFLPDSIDMQTT